MAIQTPPKVSFVLIWGAGKYAWSERHYLPNAPNVIDPGSKGLALNFANQRNQILGAGVQMLSIEMHDETNLRSTSQVPLPVSPAPGNCYNALLNGIPGPEGSFADFPYADLMARKEAADGASGVVYHSQYYVACNPDQIQRSAQFPPQDGGAWSDAWVQKFTPLFAPTAGTSPYGMKVLLRSGDQSPIFNVVNITVNGSNQFVVTLDNAPNFALGAQVTIRGVKGSIASTVNGARVTGAVSVGSTFLVGSGVTAPAGWVYRYGGTVQLRTYGVINYTNLLFDKYTHRKRGNSLFGVRGRKSSHRVSSVG